MTTNKPANGPKNDIHINVRKVYDDFPVGKLLVEAITAWEKGRYVVINEDGLKVASCDVESFSAAIQKAAEYMLKFSAALLGEALQQVAPLVFDNGVKYGLSQNTARMTQQPKAALSATASAPVTAPIDSAAITKSIADQLQKMFTAGLEQGKAGHAQVATPRVKSAFHTVQRDREGGISSSVTNYQYEDLPGVNPPPL
jgi:hypothetical protein